MEHERVGDVDTIERTANKSRAIALAAITRAIAASLDVTRIFSVVAQQAQHILNHHALALLLLHPGRDAAAAPSLFVAFCHPPSVEAGQPWPLTDFSFGPALLANQ